MPTQSTTYNTRLTDESLEKRFRDTFRSQGGAELVDDLYASGVIVPVVDFTAAAEGSALRQDLQTAWDFATSQNQVANGTVALVSTPGFFKVDLTAQCADFTQNTGAAAQRLYIYLDTGITTKKIWSLSDAFGTVDSATAVAEDQFVVFLRTGDTLRGFSAGNEWVMNISTRQIADVNGNLTQPSGFTFS